MPRGPLLELPERARRAVSPSVIYRRAEEEAERTELRGREEATQRVLDACERVLGAVD